MLFRSLELITPFPIIFVLLAVEIIIELIISIINCCCKKKKLIENMIRNLMSQSMIYIIIKTKELIIIFPMLSAIATIDWPGMELMVASKVKDSAQGIQSQ